MTHRILKEGSKSADTITLQQHLRQLGYPVSTDGIFGPATTLAVKDFQASKGLSADGIVDAQTWWTLIAATEEIQVKVDSEDDTTPTVDLRGELLSWLIESKSLSALMGLNPHATNTMHDFLYNQGPVDQYILNWVMRLKEMPPELVNEIDKLIKLYQTASAKTEVVLEQNAEGSWVVAHRKPVSCGNHQRSWGNHQSQMWQTPDRWFNTN